MAYQMRSDLEKKSFFANNIGTDKWRQRETLIRDRERFLELKHLKIDTFLDSTYPDLTPEQIDNILNKMSKSEKVRDVLYKMNPASGVAFGYARGKKELPRLADAIKNKINSEDQKKYNKYSTQNSNMWKAAADADARKAAADARTFGGKKKTKKKTTTKTKKKKKKVVKRKLHKGPRGGKYYVSKGRKVYV